MLKPRVSLENTNKHIISSCCNILRLLGITFHIYEFRNKHKSDVWRIVIYRQEDIRKLLLLLIPHLAGQKKYRSILLRDYCELAVERMVSGKYKYSQQEWDIYKSFIKR